MKEDFEHVVELTGAPAASRNLATAEAWLGITDGRTMRPESVGDGACDLRRLAVSRRVDDKSAGHEVLACT
jgi:hypothetical protein